LTIDYCNITAEAQRSQRKDLLLKKKKKIISHRGAEITEKDFIADAPGLLKSPRNRAGTPDETASGSMWDALG